MTSILITGANGFIGSHFGQRARRRGWRRVLGADLAAQDMTGNCHDYREVDLGTPGAGDLLDTLPAPDVVLHAGGISGLLLRTIYLATLVWPTSMPSLRSSPRILGAPQTDWRRSSGGYPLYSGA